MVQWRGVQAGARPSKNAEHLSVFTPSSFLPFTTHPSLTTSRILLPLYGYRTASWICRSIHRFIIMAFHNSSITRFNINNHNITSPNSSCCNSHNSSNSSNQRSVILIWAPKMV
jgi:hypothetical protein